MRITIEGIVKLAAALVLAYFSQQLMAQARRQLRA